VPILHAHPRHPKAQVMPKNGYSAYTFSVHPHGQQADVLPLGDLGDAGDGLTVLYGTLRGIADTGVLVGSGYLRTESAIGTGRIVKFRVAVGQGGITSDFLDQADDDKLVFKRTDKHIEANTLRGLLVAPSRSRSGLLILEMRGRSRAETILCPALKQAFRNHTGLILDFSAVVDEAALQQYLAQAAIKGITLRRSGLPSDIADVVNLARDDRNIGQLEMRITPGGIRAFTRTIVDKLRDDRTARRSLLQVGGLEFSDVSITMELGERQRTLRIDADHIPSFVYDLPGGEPLSHDAFFKEVLSSVEDIAQAFGVTVGRSWQDGAWSREVTETTIELPAEDPGDEQAGGDAWQ
jgi:hypothetical protein